MSLEKNGKQEDATTLEEEVSATRKEEGASSSSLKLSTKETTKQDDDETNTESIMDTYFPDPDMDHPSWLESVSWWSEYTSIHGVYYAFERGHFEKWKQWLWFVLVCLCTAGLITTLVFMIDEFKEYNISTSIRPVIPKALDFPQVTVCNTNLYSTYLQNETGIIEPTNEEELNAISQPLDELMIFTNFNKDGIQVDSSRVWTPIITSFGQCFSFLTKRQVLKPGSGAGLEFGAWVNQTNYMQDTIEAGLYVFVTQPGTTMISDQTRQVLVPPGGTAFLGIHQINIQRVTEQPWSHCDGTAPNYTNEVCRTQCINDATRQLCNCRQLGDPVDATSLPYCTSEDIELGACAGISTDSLTQCDCQTSPCSEQAFDITASFAKLATHFRTKVEQEYNLPNNEEMDDNFVHVVVNFDSIRYDEITESKSTSFAQLISDLGGQMGFFMGISMISVMELFGELIGFRLLPRLWGDTRLYGIGQRHNHKELGIVK